MYQLSQIDIVSSGLYWTVACLLFFLIAELWTFRPAFVVPDRFVDTTIDWAERFVRWLMVLCVALIPLQVTLPSTNYTLDQQEFPMYVLLDSSLSMSADDLSPSRFAVAKQLIGGIIAGMERLRVGVIIFSGLPIEVVPLSDHLQAVSQRIQEVSIADFPVTTEYVGTAVGDALLIALERLSSFDASAIVLISDGSSSRGVDAMEAAYLADKAGVPIYTIAIGADDFVVGYDNQGNEVVAAYETETLQSVSQMSQGAFFEVNNAEKLQQRIETLLVQLEEQQEVGYRTERVALNRYLLPALLALVFLYLAWKMTVLLAVIHKR